MNPVAVVGYYRAARSGTGATEPHAGARARCRTGAAPAPVYSAAGENAPCRPHSRLSATTTNEAGTTRPSARSTVRAVASNRCERVTIPPACKRLRNARAHPSVCGHRRSRLTPCSQRTHADYQLWEVGAELGREARARAEEGAKGKRVGRAWGRVLFFVDVVEHVRAVTV